MKKWKVVLATLLFALIVIFVYVVNGVQNAKGIPEPSVKISVGSQAIKTIYYGDRYNEKRDEMERFLNFSFEEGWEAIPYVQIGEEVDITFDNFEATDVQITDVILTKEGRLKYGEQSDMTYGLKAVDGKLRYGLPSNPAVHLSSNLNDYAPGHVIRACFIRTQINGSNFLFSFVIRTNP
ncbi:MAG: hypothetical protein LCH34_10580 [Firmicutes bacterium]|nr:hypothetical protein [Bacillota bacterium]